MTNLFQANAYVEDILDQPGALSRTISSFMNMVFDDLDPFARQLRSGKLRRVVLTGMGSSYHAFHPLFLGLVRHGLDVQMIETSELIHHATGLISADTLIVLASQSGQSAEVLQLLEQTPQEFPLIGITNTAESPLAARARAFLLTQAGNEYSVSCKTYITALAAMALLEKLLAGEDPGPVLAELDCLPEAVDRYFSRLENYIEHGERDAGGRQRRLSWQDGGRLLRRRGPGG